MLVGEVKFCLEQRGLLGRFDDDGLKVPKVSLERGNDLASLPELLLSGHLRGERFRFGLDGPATADWAAP